MMNPFGAMKDQCRSVDMCINVMETKFSWIKTSSMPSKEDELRAYDTLRFIGNGLKKMHDENPCLEETVNSSTDIDELLSSAKQFLDSFDQKCGLLETQLEPFGYKPKAKVNQVGSDNRTSEVNGRVTRNTIYGTPCKGYGVGTLWDESGITELEITPNLFRSVKKL